MVAFSAHDVIFPGNPWTPAFAGVTEWQDAQLRWSRRKKSGSGGGNPEPHDRGRIARPCTRFGGQTCKGEPYAYNMGGGLGLLFEESVTI